MEGSKREFSFRASYPSQSSVLCQGNISKLPDGRILQPLPGGPPHLENSLAMVRGFTSPGLHLEDHEDPSFVYPRSNVTLLSDNQHHSSYQPPQRTSLSEIDPYPYAADSPRYPPSLHQYHLRPVVDLYPVASHDVDSAQLSPSTITPPTLDLTPLSAANASLPSNYAALRRYHETQTRQHAQGLQQLTRSSTGRSPTATNSAKDVAFPSSYELDVIPVDEEGLYQTPCSIPMSNNRLPQQLPPKHPSRDQQHSHLPANKYQYPSNNDLHHRYPQKHSSDDLENLDIADTRVFTAQSIHVYDETAREPASAYHVSTTTIHAPIPTQNTATTISLHSTVEVLRSGVRSNTVHSLSQPDLAFCHRATDATKASLSSASLPNLAALAASYVDTRNSQYPTKVPDNQLKNGIQEPEKVEPVRDERNRGPQKNSVEVVDGYTDGQDGKRARNLEKPKVEEDTTDDLRPNDELPVKKKKKSKMHECQVCHKHFPRPSGLKTHMNTHNNEKPFPCHFPGCNRTFGVRSNAKRHLRTHGVIPSQNTGPQPYVVDFSTPMVLDETPRRSNGDSADRSMGSGDSERTENAAVSPKGRPGRGRGRQFKLRWMPPSSASRARAPKGKGKKTVVDFRTDLPQQNFIHGQGEDYDEEDSDAQTDEGDMDFDNELDEQDDETFEGDDDINRLGTEGEETGRSTEIQSRPVSPQRSPAPPSRNSLSSSGLDSGSASTNSTSTMFSMRPPASSFSFSSWPPQSLSTISLPEELKVGQYDLSYMTSASMRNPALLSFPV